MTDRPILMNAEMVRATLSGAKAQTRRIVKDLPDTITRFAGPWMKQDGTCANGADWSFGSGEIKGDPQNFFVDKKMPCPFGVPGDRLWVRETFFIDLFPYCDEGPLPKEKPQALIDDPYPLYFRADGECCEQIPECCCAEVGKPRWRPSIHMPRWASRITLEVTGVRVERLQDISEEDAKLEGADGAKYLGQGFDQCVYREAFRALWESINGTDSGDVNPWVWVIDFKRVT